MLLAGLQGEPVGGGTVGIDGDADQTPGQLPFEAGPGCEIAGVRAAEPERTPKRWVVPTAMSAPNSPGVFSRVSASRSAATTTCAPRSWAASTTGARSRTAPDAPGYCTSTPNTSPSGRGWAKSCSTTRRPSGTARVRTTSSVCGNASTSTRKVSPFFTARWASAMASAAAVDSSSIDAPATGRPVRSSTIVWKFSNASSRPWLISGW